MAGSTSNHEVALLARVLWLVPAKFSILEKIGAPRHQELASTESSYPPAREVPSRRGRRCKTATTPIGGSALVHTNDSRRKPHSKQR